MAHLMYTTGLVDPWKTAHSLLTIQQTPDLLSHVCNNKKARRFLYLSIYLPQKLYALQKIRWKKSLWSPGFQKLIKTISTVLSKAWKTAQGWALWRRRGKNKNDLNHRHTWCKMPCWWSNSINYTPQHPGAYMLTNGISSFCIDPFNTL